MATRKQKLVGSIVALLVLAGAVVAGILIGNDTTEPQAPAIISPSVTPSARPTIAAPPASLESETQTVDARHYRYINRRLGYSIVLPVRNGLCGQSSTANAPVKYFESGDKTFIATDCSGLTTSKLTSMSETDILQLPGFTIVATNVNGDAGLESVAKQVFEPQCRISSKKPATQEGVVTVELGPPGALDDPQACRSADYSFVYYQAASGKVVILHNYGGQSPKFLDPSTREPSQYDDQFRFL